MNDEDFITMPEFKDEFEAAHWAVEWARENPNVYLTYGGPMYPVPCETFQAELSARHGVTIKATAGCELCNYEGTVADIVNSMLCPTKRKHASRCARAWFQGLPYRNEDYEDAFCVPHPYPRST